MFLIYFVDIEERTEWDFKRASKIINSIDRRMGAKPANKDLIPLLHNIKSHLVDFERTLENDNAQATNREVINRKDSSSSAKGVKTFKGHKIIRVTDDFEGICFYLIHLIDMHKYVAKWNTKSFIFSH